MSVGRFLQQAAAGNAGEAVYVDDVFSTYLYTGNGSTQTITNGIDLDGEGGLVWQKNRSNAAGVSHYLWDTERGSTKRLSTNTTGAEVTTDSSWISSFNSDGFSIGNSGAFNASGENYASWTFRKQPGFFDVVTYTGNATAGTEISHNLGSAPGMIIIKRTNSTSNWAVYHRSSNYLVLNSTAAAYSTAITAARFGDGTNVIAPTESVFTIGGDADTNQAGSTYVAYLFAHDAQDFGANSDESIIKCGSYTGTGSNPNNIDLGFEPQWLLSRRVDSASSWIIFDNMRGVTTGGDDALLYPNLASAEAPSSFIDFNSTGFNAAPTQNASGGTYIYVAIRRPHKPASEFAATQLFDPQYGTVTTPVVTTGFPVDFFIERSPSGSDGWYFFNRLTDKKYLKSESTAAEGTGSLSRFFDFSDGVMSSWSQANQYVIYSFKRAPEFFDVVAYAGNSVSGDAKAHSLGVTPEMIIIKNRNNANDWNVWHSSLSATQSLRLNLTNAVENNSWWTTSPTNQYFYPNNYQGINQSGYNYIAYLFATVPGISKVGSYTGNGGSSAQTIDCGFSSGARFVMIKRTDSGSDWNIWDSERGITSGNDPYLRLNTTDAQNTTSTLDIEPDSSGFIVQDTNLNINASGGTYIFLAIA